MRIIPTNDAVFEKVETSLDAHQNDVELEPLAGIDCDEQDLENQRKLGDEDPIVTVEIIARWLPETSEGILDWFYLRQSGEKQDPPPIEHGGPLLAFNSKGEEPDLDILVDNAVTRLNESITWAEFELEEEV
ncbi:hypothetical protein HW115_10790 [Verrucomicrobiaceae bacterium N1E253]|uniref:Uncharacterized protein n=1 Tax=Oceaniferula marina TaxID=2748318 RepID=A0A851GM12_9BACT|nr:hypothetical protein [Oceaniferula marina]NWK56097.1 hypothetical protein [Oceaniferula marina]